MNVCVARTVQDRCAIVKRRGNVLRQWPWYISSLSEAETCVFVPRLINVCSFHEIFMIRDPDSAQGIRIRGTNRLDWPGFKERTNAQITYNILGEKDSYFQCPIRNSIQAYFRTDIFSYGVKFQKRVKISTNLLSPDGYDPVIFRDIWEDQYGICAIKDSRRKKRRKKEMMIEAGNGNRLSCFRVLNLLHARMSGVCCSCRALFSAGIRSVLSVNTVTW